MDKNDAKDLLDLFYRRAKSTALLTDAQRNTVLSTIMRTYDDASEVTISDVRRIVEKEVAPPAPRKIEMPATQRNEFTAQEQAEQQRMLANVFRNRLVPGLANPFAYDQQGNVVGVDNSVAFELMSAGLGRWYKFFGNKPMVEGRIVELIARIDLEGLSMKMSDGSERIVRWPHVATVPPRVDVNPPAPAKLDDNQINNQRLERERQMNSQGDSPIRGARTTTKTVATREELEKAAADDTAEAAAAATITAMIKNHTGKSHGASAAESKLLAQLSEQARAEGKSFTETQALIVAKKVEMLKWDAQRAIREVYAPVAAKKGLSLDKTPKAFQPEEY